MPLATSPHFAQPPTSSHPAPPSQPANPVFTRAPPFLKPQSRFSSRKPNKSLSKRDDADTFCHFRDTFCRACDTFCHSRDTFCRACDTFCHFRDMFCRACDTFCHLRDTFCRACGHKNGPLVHRRAALCSRAALHAHRSACGMRDCVLPLSIMSARPLGPGARLYEVCQHPKGILDERCNPLSFTRCLCARERSVGRHWR